MERHEEVGGHPSHGPYAALIRALASLTLTRSSHNPHTALTYPLSLSVLTYPEGQGRRLAVTLQIANPLLCLVVSQRLNLKLSLVQM
jgi:hypothetical protein